MFVLGRRLLRICLLGGMCVARACLVVLLRRLAGKGAAGGLPFQTRGRGHGVGWLTTIYNRSE